MELHKPSFILLLLLISSFSTLSSSKSSSSSSTTPTSPTDVDLLLSKIKPTLQGTTQSFLLSSWNKTTPLCQWHGLKWVFSNGSNLNCESLSSPLWSDKTLSRNPSIFLYSIQLPSANLSGSIPRELGAFSALQSIYLSINNLSMQVPLELGYSSSLTHIDLGHNSLSGSLPSSLWNLCDRLVVVRLHGNTLSGSLPTPALPNTTCDNLEILDVGDNLFTGLFPDFVTGFSSLQVLDLSHNLFTGLISEDVVHLTKLSELNLSYNNFSGVVPNFGGSKFGVDAFVGNSPTLCGYPLRGCVGESSMSPGAIAGLVIGMMTGSVVAVSLVIGYFQNRRKKNRGENEDELDECDDDEEAAVENGEAKLIVFQGGEHLTLEDVLNATGQVIEKTSYGTSYKAKLADGGTIALRLLREGCCKDRSSCLPVVKQLGRLRHENLDPLRAFYQGKRGEKLLIYDYVPTRTLYELLHETKLGKPVLNWTRRHKIALGIARGLSYLHTGLETTMTHGNVKSKNVLVDDFFVARLTEIGVDRLVIPEVADEMLSQLKGEGYRAPELQRMNKSNPRTDVYAFGIMLLEILIGKKPDKNSRSGDFLDLPSMVKTAVLEETTMEVFDVEVLKGIRSPMEDGLVHALKLAMGCCAPVASARPTMDEVVKQLEENRPRNRSALYSPTETRSGTGTPF
ncbi:hypothetical protein RND81_05G219500 [Saponaria officinalis]|uniref:Protein kinase domain-containing protein n=1 Tax=Saponaria officinalis TaxID=3572 RepID=A0AAW1L167_SAPOF